MLKCMVHGGRVHAGNGISVLDWHAQCLVHGGFAHACGRRRGRRASLEGLAHAGGRRVGGRAPNDACATLPAAAPDTRPCRNPFYTFSLQTEAEYEKEKLNERIARLSGGVAVIQVRNAAALGLASTGCWWGPLYDLSSGDFMYSHAVGWGWGPMYGFG